MRQQSETSRESQREMIFLVLLLLWSAESVQSVQSGDRKHTEQQEVFFGMMHVGWGVEEPTAALVKDPDVWGAVLE
jgi:hypothetical protein